jgi:hypothetical protein
MAGSLSRGGVLNGTGDLATTACNCDEQRLNSAESAQHHRTVCPGTCGGIPVASPDHWIAAAPATALDGTKEAFDLGIDGRRLLQIDGVTRVGQIQRPAPGSANFSIRLVSRQGASSSPTAAWAQRPVSP